MKRINPATGAPFRCGDVNTETGMVFRMYDTKRMRKDGTFQEIWLRPEVWAAINERQRLRARERRKLAKTMQSHFL